MASGIKRVKFFLFNRRGSPDRNVNCTEAQNILSAAIDRLLRAVCGDDVRKRPPQ